MNKLINNIEVENLIQDLLKFLTIFIVTNLLMFLIDSNNKLFSLFFIKITTSFLIGIIVYWSLIKPVTQLSWNKWFLFYHGRLIF